MNQEKKVVAVNFKALSLPLAILGAGALVGLGLFFGLSGKTPGTNPPSGANPPTEVADNQPGLPPQTGKTSLDDDAVLGDKKTAKLALIEFSDYECSFCARFWSETLPEIKKNYIDTGRLVFVYRDFPLTFHNPAAEREAMATECAREQGGDKVFFQYHDQIFELSPGNGQGLSEAKLAAMAQDMGLDKGEFAACLKEERFKEEVAKDMADGAQAGIGGTPGFILGKLGSDDQVEGTIISGAMPYASFKAAIEEELNKE